MRWPVSVKAVVLRDGCVLLGQNDRAEWELPGGRMEPGECTRQTLIRELHEEAGIRVAPRQLVLAEPFEVVPGSMVFIVVYAAVAEDKRLTMSDEHTALDYVPIDVIGEIALPAIYRSAIALATT